MSNSPLQPILDFYAQCLAEHGATCQGVGWPRPPEAERRLKVISGLWQDDPAQRISVLDLGCGYGALLDYMAAQPPSQAIDYWGIDMLPAMIEAAAQRHPGARFEQRDILAEPLPERCVDYVAINGILTCKAGIAQAEMVRFAERLLDAAFRACRKGIAFNVMNQHVDWTRDDLFHWPFDEAASFLRARCSRHYRFRADYGLYEYMAFVTREPNEAL